MTRACYHVILVLVLFLSYLDYGESLNPVKKKVVNSGREVHTRFYAKIPNYKGKPSKIVSMTHRGPNLYVCTSTSGGLIYKVSPNRKVTLWFDVATAMVKSTGRKMNTKNVVHGGLRSVAFHPKFASNGLFYTAVMEQKPKNPSKFKYFSRSKKQTVADSVVIEWKFSKQQGKVIQNSYRQVIRIGMPEFDHPIRSLLFVGPNLFITHGDGSVQSATAGGGLKNDGLGKVLRINPLKQGGNPYTIPGNNPFKGNSKWKDEIFAVGFRNPITICKARRGDVGLVVVDVGRDNVDEVNLLRAGGNYGWSKREGTFVHLPQGGLLNGVKGLPGNDQKNNFIYPAAQVGHSSNRRGAQFIAQALTGSCPIENGSPLSGVMLYANFAGTGTLYFSTLNDLAKARTKGPPSKLTQATTFKPKIMYDHDGKKNTPPKQVPNLRAIIRFDPGKKFDNRADIRFGRGSKGEIYWSSKRNGKIYVITSSLPSANK